MLERLTKAIEIVNRSTTRPGPQKYGNSMPDIVREFDDFVGRDQKRGERFDEFASGIDAQSKKSIAAAELALADQALSWPLRYLPDRELWRDAIWLSCASHALGFELKRALRRRCKIADRMVEERKADNPDVIRIYEDDAGDAATKVVFWANKALAATKDRRAQGRIRRGARILFKREIRATKAIEHFTFVRRHDVMPGKVFVQQRVSDYRHRGAIAIAEGLARDGVEVK